MNDWKNDFESFLKEEPIAVPSDLSQKVLAGVKSDLDPASLLVFFKLAVLHLFSGALTLTICPQFGFGPLGGGSGLMAYFMRLGHVSCALGCGTLFLGTTALVSLIFLSIPEQKAIARHGFYHFGILGAVSIAVLMSIGRITAGEWFDESLSYILLWLAAGATAGFLIFKLKFTLPTLARKN